MPYNPKIHQRLSIRLKGYDYSQEGLYFITICVQGRVCLFGEIVGAVNIDDVNKHPIMKLSDAGKIAEQCWLAIPQHFPNVLLHEYVVMPNHIHGIIEITGNHSSNIVGVNDGTADVGVNDGTADVGANDGTADVGANDGTADVGANDGTVDVGANDGTVDVGANDGTVDVGANDGTADVGANDGTVDVGAKYFSPLRSPSRTIGSIVRGFKIGVTKWFEQSVWQRNYYEHVIRSMDEYERITNYIINNPAKWHEDHFYK